LDYSAEAQQLATSAFAAFQPVADDTLNKLVFGHDFACERNTGLLAQGKAYIGYCLVYVDDRNVYQFRIILAKARLQTYRGDKEEVIPPKRAKRRSGWIG
jgi:hypothetical protein